MGKKNKKRIYSGSGMYDQKRNEVIAEHLLAYVDSIENLFILEGKEESEIEDAIKVVTKACKNLIEGKPEKVFNEERYDEVFGELDFND